VKKTAKRIKAGRRLFPKFIDAEGEAMTVFFWLRLIDNRSGICKEPRISRLP